MLCCPTSSCEKCYTQTRAVPGLSHLTEMAACQLIFQGVACLHTKNRAKQASTGASVAQDEGKMGEGANRQEERSGLPLLEEAICSSAGLPPIRDLDSSRELRTG